MGNKSKPLAIILSIIIPGLGLLYADAGNNIGKFLFSFILGILIIPWLLGIYWTNNVVNQVNGTA